MKARDALNRERRLGKNRHARRAVREYYGLPSATAHVANSLIDWKNGWLKGDTLAKRKAFRDHIWHEWDVAAFGRMQRQINADLYAALKRQVAQSVAYRGGKTLTGAWLDEFAGTVIGRVNGGNPTTEDLASSLSLLRQSPDQGTRRAASHDVEAGRTTFCNAIEEKE